MSAAKMDTDPFFPGDIMDEQDRRATILRPTDSPFERTRGLLKNRDSPTQNLLEKPGRYSLQPQPIGTLKMNEPIQPYRPERQPHRHEMPEKENQKP